MTMKIANNFFSPNYLITLFVDFLFLLCIYLFIFVLVFLVFVGVCSIQVVVFSNQLRFTLNKQQCHKLRYSENKMEAGLWSK